MNKKIFIKSNSADIDLLVDDLLENGVDVKKQISFGLDSEIVQYIITFTSQAAVILNCIISYRNYKRQKIGDNFKDTIETKKNKEIDISKLSKSEISQLLEEIKSINLQEEDDSLNSDCTKNLN